MDPDTCMDEALAAYRDRDYETLQERLEAYDGWLSKGGFAGETAPDVAEALYWLCVWNHTGQSCPLYYAQCINPFRPGPISNGPEPGTYAADIVSEEAP